jgi:hypothetical protein
MVIEHLCPVLESNRRMSTIIIINIIVVRILIVGVILQ